MSLADGSPQADPHRIQQDLSNDLMSPYCPGRTISACPSSAARKLEDDILAQAESGKTREEIEADLVARYGDQIIGYAPRPVVLYGTAVVALVALFLLAWVGRRWVQRRAVVGAPAAASTGASTVASADGQSKPTRAELDALDDALDEEEAF